MDDQHAILMDTINELRLVLVHGRGRDLVAELLNRLIEFTRMHFWTEEQLMEQNDFPGLSEHRIEHEHLLTQIRESIYHAQHSDHVHMRSLLLSLRDVYLQHIEGLDQLYGPWLNDRGIY
jgi:hemerythrin